MVRLGFEPTMKAYAIITRLWSLILYLMSNNKCFHFGSVKNDNITTLSHQCKEVCFIFIYFPFSPEKFSSTRSSPPFCTYVRRTPFFRAFSHRMLSLPRRYLPCHALLLLLLSLMLL